MMNFRNKARGHSLPKEHEYYLELCALASSGTLMDAEWAELRSHLSGCHKCQKLFQEYRELAKIGMALLTPEASAGDLTVQEAWSPELAKQELFLRLEREERAGHYHLRSKNDPMASGWRRNYLLASRWSASLAYAATVALIAGSFLTGYWLGQPLGLMEPARPEIQTSPSETASLRAQLDKVLDERASLKKSLHSREEEVATLDRDVQRRLAEVSKVKELLSEFEQKTQQQILDITRLIADRDALSRSLQNLEATLVATQQLLDASHEERAALLLRSAMLEERIAHVSARLTESDTIKKEQQILLAADRDIRELMGARELYIADVFDVDDGGRVRKPYGRVFYTRQKSLIFYAFDLDQQPGVRNAIFQAWGRRGAIDNEPLSLGILYLDSDTDKRWALRFDDPAVLAKIDAVFVTVERKAESKPSARHLLFASLRTPPNHR